MQRGAAPSAAHHEVTLDAAVDAARTGDVWIFRGRSHADRAIRLATNAPVNHVGMAVVLDDLPPMMWHAELGRSLTDMWTGDHHRGVQLHDLRAAVQRWTGPYRQQAWMRQLTPDVGREQEDAVLRTIARWDGTSFPSTTTLGWRWVRGRRWSLPSPPKRRHMWRSSDTQEAMTSSPETSSAARSRAPRPPTAPRSSPSRTRRWASSPPTDPRTGMTRAASGAATASPSPPAGCSAPRSPSASTSRRPPETGEGRATPRSPGPRAGRG